MVLQINSNLERKLRKEEGFKHSPDDLEAALHEAQAEPDKNLQSPDTDLLNFEQKEINTKMIAAIKDGENFITNFCLWSGMNLRLFASIMALT